MKQFPKWFKCIETRYQDLSDVKGNNSQPHNRKGLSPHQDVFCLFLLAQAAN